MNTPKITRRTLAKTATKRGFAKAGMKSLPRNQDPFFKLETYVDNKYQQWLRKRGLTDSG